MASPSPITPTEDPPALCVDAGPVDGAQPDLTGIVSIRGAARMLTSAGAGPHGFTLSVWGAGMVTARVQGLPGAGQVMLFVTGAALAFWLVHLSGRGVANGGLLALTDLPPLAVLQVVASLVAVLAAWGAAHVSHRSVVWLLVGASASAAYWLVAAATLYCAGVSSRRARRGERQRSTSAPDC